MTSPSVIVEVLSPGTESFDRGDKFAGYRSIEGLRHYVMLSLGRNAVVATAP